jgi:hypothetical protein
MIAKIVTSFSLHRFERKATTLPAIGGNFLPVQKNPKKLAHVA